MLSTKTKFKSSLIIFKGTEGKPPPELAIAGAVLTALVFAIRRHRDDISDDKSLIRRLELWQDSHAGRPILVFPASGGSHNEYGDFGMIAACRPWIDSGQVRFFTPDSFDNEAFEANEKSPHDRALAHMAYERFIVEELVPLIYDKTQWAGGLITTGCSMGAYHAMNFGLKFPEIFDTVISLSGLYDLRFVVGDYGDDALVYYNSPTDYLWNLADPWFFEKYRQNTYIICTGLGPWEEVDETRKLEAVFNAKQIPGWFDYWGADVSHDWVWWKKQMPYYLSKLSETGQI